MAPQNETTPQNRSLEEILKSYFYWTYKRGSFHYDIMVTLILLFIFVTPHLWNYGDGYKPSPIAGPAHPIVVSSTAGRNVIVTVRASDVDVSTSAPDAVVRNALRLAIDPVMGDAVSVEHWETFTDAEGNLDWKVWAHR
jgi:hypothetical protein